MRAQDGNSEHLDDRALTALHDGELTPSRAAEARAHLEHCPRCRARSQALQLALDEFTAYFDQEADRFGRPPDSRPPFLSWLPDAPAARPAWTAPRLPARAVAAAAIVFCLFYGLFTDQVLPSARAMEVLRRARDRESARLARLPDPVVHQRLSVTGSGGEAQWEIWRTVRGDEHASRWTGNDRVKVELFGAFSASGWDADKPLSPDIFRGWLARADIDGAEAVNDRRRVSVHAYRRAAGGAGTIYDASMTLTLDDLHPIEQRIRFRSAGGTREFCIREVAFDNVLYAAAPFGSAATREARRMPGVAPRPPAPSIPAADDLEIAEAEARWKLHQLGADLQLAPEIAVAGNEVLVRVLADTAARRDEIRAALAGVPCLRVEVWTPDEAPASLLTRPDVAASESAPLHRTRPLLGVELVRCLGPEAADDFIAAAHRQVRSAMVPVLALKALAEHYPDARYRKAPAAARDRLDRIAFDYLAALRRTVTPLSRAVATTIGACGVAGNAGDAHQSAAESLHGWAEAAHACARDLRQLDSSFNLLFITQESTEPPVAAGEAVRRLLDSSAALAAIDAAALSVRPVRMVAADAGNP